jgi:hypothetical protein
MPNESQAEREQLRISESAVMLGLAEGEDRTEDGTVLLHLMRPCLGKGRGRHIYEADMLQHHADSGHFNDWPMFVDHESPAARKKAEGLPRSLRDVGGRVVRTWWDPTVEADTSKGFGKGAVVAEAKPVPWVHELIEHDPKLVNVSLNTFATGVRPKSVGGRPAYVVEGFADKGSADWVTLPGAGGRVVQLLEAAIEQADDDTTPDELLEGLSDDELAAHIRKHRPRVAEAINDEPGDSGEEETDMDRKEVQEAAIESLRTDEGKAVLQEVVAEAVESSVGETIKKVLPEAIGAAAATIEEGARRAASAEVRQGQLATRAHKKIVEAKLPERFEQSALSRFERVNLEDTVDDESGDVTETAEQKLDALVEAEIKESRELVASVNPTAVRENGDGGGEDDVTENGDKPDTSHMRHQLQEAGIDWRTAYGVTESEETPEEKKDKGGKDEEREAEGAAA